VFVASRFIDALTDIMDSDPLAWLPAPDRIRFAHQAAMYEGCKTAAELYGFRNRRFSLLVDVEDDLTKPPPRGTKRIRCIRHGEGAHNVFREVEFAAGRKPHAKRGNWKEVADELFDPHLTEKGEQEAAANQELLEKGQDPELLVVSPLRRACKTGLIAFAKAIERGMPVLANELARECYLGIDPSIYDAHRGRDELEAEFTTVEFRSNVPPGGRGLEGDFHWWGRTSPCGMPLEAGETVASHGEKAYQLLCWLMDRSEQDIAVASHSLFLMCLFHAALDHEDSRGEKRSPASAQIFRTGELRTFLVAEREVPISPASCALQ